MCAHSVDDIRRMIAETPDPQLPALLGGLAEDPRAGVRSAVAAGQARLERARVERARLSKLYGLESQLRRSGYLVVAGVDEVGRGALAGPLTAAAVVLPPRPHIEGLDDSKRLTPAQREDLDLRIRSVAVCMSIVHVGSDEVDAIGIAGAVRRAMALALGELATPADHVVVDGLPVGVAQSETAVVKGDSLVAAIAAASVVAKVSRDALMRAMATEYPEYAFEINKGYGTNDHMRAIERFGLTPLHRRSFSPCGGTMSLF
jgi:ribonuclease HII